jgi:hypothetical protein
MRAPLLFKYRPRLATTVPGPADTPPDAARAAAVVWIEPDPPRTAADSAELIRIVDGAPPSPESR